MRTAHRKSSTLHCKSHGRSARASRGKHRISSMNMSLRSRLAIARPRSSSHLNSPNGSGLQTVFDFGMSSPKRFGLRMCLFRKLSRTRGPSMRSVRTPSVGISARRKKIAEVGESMGPSSSSGALESSCGISHVARFLRRRQAQRRQMKFCENPDGKLRQMVSMDGTTPRRRQPAGMRSIAGDVFEDGDNMRLILENTAGSRLRSDFRLPVSLVAGGQLGGHLDENPLSALGLVTCRGRT